MKKQPKPTLYLILTAVTLLAGSGAIAYQYMAYGEKAEQAKKLRAEALDADAIQKNLEESQLEVNQAKERLAHLEKGVPQFAYIPTMLKELEALGKQQGIEVLGARPIPKPVDPKADPKKRPPYDELIIEIKGRGSYRSALNFLNALTKFPKIVAARTVALQPKNDGPGASNASGRVLDVTIELRAFVFPVEASEAEFEIQVGDKPQANAPSSGGQQGG